MKYLLLFVSVLTLSCSKKEEVNLACVNEAISKMGSCIDRVNQYEYRGKTVFFFEDGTCADGISYLVDSQCKTICEFGGLIGHTGEGCPNFDTEKKFVKEIWSR